MIDWELVWTCITDMLRIFSPGQLKPIRLNPPKFLVVKAKLRPLTGRARLRDIPADYALASHPLTLKMNIAWIFIDTLFNAGRTAAVALHPMAAA